MAKPPFLFLFIEQGPKSGHCLKCKPCKRATVGRAKANTLPIPKDCGVSQKHLAFFWVQSCDEDDAGWFVLDVGSSNGTLLNDLPIQPNLPISIKAGDLIKIGAETTIRVDIPSPPEISNATELPRCTGSKHTDSHAKICSVLGDPHKVCSQVSQTCHNCDKLAPVPKIGLDTDHPLPDNNHSKHILPFDENHCQHVSASVQHHRVGASKERGGQEPEHDEIKCSAHGIDLSMTVEEWFTHLMEEGPKYLHRVAESMIQDILLESKQFDDYVLSLNQGQ